MPFVSTPLTLCLDCSFFTLNIPRPSIVPSPIITVFLLALFVQENPPTICPMVAGDRPSV